MPDLVDEQFETVAEARRQMAAGALVLSIIAFWLGALTGAGLTGLLVALF